MNYSGQFVNITKLRNSCWKICSGPCGYLKHVITKDALIALQTPVRGAQVLWLVCLCISLSVSPRGYLRNYTCDLYQLFGEFWLRSWLELPSAKGSEVCYLRLPCCYWNKQNCMVMRLLQSGQYSCPWTLNKSRHKTRKKREYWRQTIAVTERPIPHFLIMYFWHPWKYRFVNRKHKRYKYK